MEENLMKRRSVHGGSEKRSTDSSGDEDDVVAKAGKKRPYPENDDIKPSSPAQKDSSITKQQDDELKSAKAEMGEVREENQRLKMYLNRMIKDYQDLQMQFYDIVGQGPKKSTATRNQQVVEEEEPELVSLTLGRSSTDSKKEDKNKTSNEDAEKSKEGLSLGLDYKFEASKSDADDESLSKQSSCHEQKEEETWAASKVLKTGRSGDDESLQQNPVKKARVCVRARCDTPTMNDGCQWRKYGQKIAKGNPCPRAYYRCTVAASCPVRKQVQRCAEDMSILITTYEGTHNHPLPMSAKAMASTTSSAASMLLSGSSSTSSNPSMVNTTVPANLHGLNFYVSENSNSKFYMPNSSLSASSSHQTITLDLTSTPSSSSSLLNRFSSANPSTARYPSTCLSFGSSESNTVWSNGFFSYGGTHPYMKNQIVGRPQTVENSIYQLMQKSNLNPPPDTIAAATKAITADPNFQSALAAALTSIIGNSGNNGGGGSATQPPGTADGFGQMLRWDKGNGCSQTGSLMFLPPSLPFSTPKSASTSPGDTRNQSN